MSSDVHCIHEQKLARRRRTGAVYQVSILQACIYTALGLHPVSYTQLDAMRHHVVLYAECRTL